jgi:MFS family permease
MAAEAPAALSGAIEYRPWSRYLAWRRWGMLSVLLLVIISNYADTFVTSVLLEPIKQDFKVSDTMLGLLSGMCFSLFYAAAAVPFARWADYGNRRTATVTALAGWSAMTLLCAFARSFTQLAGARFGVGAAASGALPPVQSLIADYFPPEQRGTALGLLNAALNIGLFLGIALGGIIAAADGWRAALIWLGAPGLVLALIARVTLAEPRIEGARIERESEPESLAQSARRLRGKPSFVLILASISVYCIFAYGSSTFMPSFMVRTLHASLSQASATWGAVILVANVVGSVVGGWLGDRLSARDKRWYGWIPAITCTLGAILYFVAFLAPDFWTFIAIEFFAESVLGVGFPPMYAGVHVVCGSRRRGLAIGVLFLAMMLCGNSIGPLIVGVLSDWLSNAQGEASLRYSLLALVFIMLPAAAGFWVSGRTIPNDLED